MTFGCRSCGAKLAYDAASRGMRCPYCGHTETVQATPETQTSHALREIPLEEGIKQAVRGLGTAVMTLGCKDCGATVNVPPNERTAKCSFCGSQQVLEQPADPNLIRPESLVPFKVPKEQSNDLFSRWVRGLWFRPSSLKYMAKVQEINGLYVPFWTFDSAVTSQWTAERGWHYTVTESYSTEENGQTVVKQREVTHTRWETAAGMRRDVFDDELICASKGLPAELVHRFQTFNTKDLVAYRPEFLAGWRAESYAIDLMPAWQTAQGRMAQKQESRCAGDVGGDTHRSLFVRNDFANVTFKHVLLPVWIAAYRYNNKAYRFLVNGQTGEVVGEAPWSVVKILLFVLLLAVLFIGIPLAYTAYTKSHDQTPASSKASAPRSEIPASVAPKPTAQPSQRNPFPASPATVRGR